MNVMELFELSVDNIPKAQKYLMSIGKMKEFEEKKVEAWLLKLFKYHN